MKRTFYLMLLFSVAALAQHEQRTNSFFEGSDTREFTLGQIMVQGEVENPGPVDLNTLPLRSVAVKEVVIEKGKETFKGAFFYSGYALYDVLNGKKVKKAAENGFSPSVDLYVIVENDKGEKVVLSWGEIYYARESFRILISKSVQGINPSKLSIKWPLPSEPRLVCGNDLQDVRFLANPTKITVKSCPNGFASAKPKEMYSPEIKIVAKSNTVTVGDIGSSVQRRRYNGIGYGHGTGFRGMLDVGGFLLKDIISANLKITADDLRQAIAVISAKDGYRCVVSMSEVMNRSDNQDFLLIEKKEDREAGRYALFAAADFFVDRNVKAVAKIEIFPER